MTITLTLFENDAYSWINDLEVAALRYEDHAKGLLAVPDRPVWADRLAEQFTRQAADARSRKQQLLDLLEGEG